MLSINDIKPYKNNAKEHPKKQIDLLAKVIKEIGWRQNVEVNQEGVIIAGHGRWLVWETYKNDPDMPEIWITDDMGNTISGKHDPRPMTPDQEKMWRLADNQLNAITGFNMDLVFPELESLPEGLKELTGFDNLIIGSDSESLLVKNDDRFKKLILIFTRDQFDIISSAIASQKESEEYKALKESENSNRNGNALFILINKYLEYEKLYGKIEE